MLTAYTCEPLTVPLAPAVEPAGPNGDCVTMPVSVAVPSPQLIVALWVSSVPRSLNVAGAKLTTLPSSAVWSAPASSVGATLWTVTTSVSQVSAPSSSVTHTFTSEQPRVGKKCKPRRVPFPSKKKPGGPNGGAVTIPDSVPVPLPQLIT